MIKRLTLRKTCYRGKVRVWLYYFINTSWRSDYLVTQNKEISSVTYHLPTEMNLYDTHGKHKSFLRNFWNSVGLKKLIRQRMREACSTLKFYRWETSWWNYITTNKCYHPKKCRTSQLEDYSQAFKSMGIRIWKLLGPITISSIFSPFELKCL